MDSNTTTTTTTNNNNEKSNSLSMYLHLKCSGAREADDFLMYTYKVRRCSKNRSHDWTECPYAHRGEKARRRDPRKFPYTGVACPEYRQSGECRRGQNCEFAHGVFEFWLHPSRYRTRVCEAGLLCPRKVCFFAHSPDQLRPEVLPECRSMRDFAATAATTTVVTIDAKEKKKKKKEEEEEEFELPDIDWVLDLVS